MEGGIVFNRIGLAEHGDGSASPNSSSPSQISYSRRVLRPTVDRRDTLGFSVIGIELAYQVIGFVFYGLHRRPDGGRYPVQRTAAAVIAITVTAIAIPVMRRDHDFRGRGPVVLGCMCFNFISPPVDMTSLDADALHWTHPDHPMKSPTTIREKRNPAVCVSVWAVCVLGNGISTTCRTARRSCPCEFWYS